MTGTTQTPEWIDQVLATNIEPKIAGLTIKRIQLPTGKFAYAVDVPMAVTLAPHQAKPQKIYYRRHNTTVLAMLDHEVRDLMRRASSPELFLTYAFTPGDGNQFKTSIKMGNRSDAPALYTSVDLIFEESAIPEKQVGRFAHRLQTLAAMSDVKPASVFHANIAIPDDMPIFAGLDVEIFYAPLLLTPNSWWWTGFQINCPGFKSCQVGRIMREGHRPPYIDWITDRFSLA